MTYAELISEHLRGHTINYDRATGIWLSVPFSPGSEVRFSSLSLDNGGLLDDKELLTNNAHLVDTISEYLEGIDEILHDDLAQEVVFHTLDALGPTLDGIF